MLDLTALDKVLKEVYTPAVREQMQKATILLSKVEKSADYIDGTGKYAVIPLMLGFNESVGARAENELLPDGGNVRYSRIESQVKTTYGVIKISGEAIRRTKSDVGAYVKAIDSEMKNMVTGLRRDINRQMFGDGTGVLATVSQNASAGNNVTITVSSAQYLKVGQVIDIYEGNTKKSTSEITSVNEDNNTIVVDVLEANLTASNTPKIYRKGVFTGDSITREMYGLGNIVNNTNWLLNPTSVPEWKANLVTLAGSGNPTSQDILDGMQSAFTKCEKNEEVPNLGICPFEVRDQYAAALTSTRRIVNTMDLEFGFKGLEYNGIAIVGDAQCPAKTMYFLNTKHLIMAVASDFDWGDADGKILFKVSGYDQYKAFMYFSAQFLTDKRNVHAKIVGWK